MQILMGKICNVRVLSAEIINVRTELRFDSLADDYIECKSKTTSVSNSDEFDTSDDCNGDEDRDVENGP